VQRAADVADELLLIAAAEGDPELELEAHHASWVYDFFLGRLEASAAHVSAVRSGVEAGELDAHALLYGGHSPALCARNFEALLAWLDGREASAAALGDETFELALSSQHLHTRAHCIAWGSIVDQLGGRVDAVVRRIDALRTLADEHGFTDFLAEARILGGWALAVQGDAASGLSEIEEGLALRETAGTNHLMPYLLGVGASAEAIAGETRQALARVEDALHLASSTGERWFEPELRRARATLWRSTGDASSAEIEEEVNRAIDLARAQGSGAFERGARELLRELGATPPGRSRRP
jgi:predicted ATPase